MHITLILTFILTTTNCLRFPLGPQMTECMQLKLGVYHMQYQPYRPEPQFSSLMISVYDGDTLLQEVMTVPSPPQHLNFKLMNSVGSVCFYNPSKTDDNAVSFELVHEMSLPSSLKTDANLRRTYLNIQRVVEQVRKLSRSLMFLREKEKQQVIYLDGYGKWAVIFNTGTLLIVVLSALLHQFGLRRMVNGQSYLAVSTSDDNQ